MNSTTVECASSHFETDWHSIDWNQVHRRVRKLQIRIVKAIQANKLGKAKALQWLLTHSFSGKVLAVRRVTENQGKRTPGVDGEIWSTPKRKMKAVFSLKRRGYKAKPLRRIYIPKSKGGKRPLDIPTIGDRAMQALHKFALEPFAETTADGSSYGFRPFRSCQDAISHAFTLLSKKGSARWILEGDIQSCFNQMSHEWLMTHIPMDKRMLSQWLKAGYVEQRQLFPTNSGAPQGGIISPNLMNMALDGLESKLISQFSKPERKLRANKVKFIRYADDFIVTGTSKEFLEHEVKPVIEAFLAKRGLKLSQEKTKITHIEDGFDFLGVTIRKYKGKLWIKPSKSSIKRLLKKIRVFTKKHKMLAQDKLIQGLNPVIRGWVNYHRSAVSSKVFNRLDHEIFKVLWQWAKRRHPNKRKRWIKKRYFKSINSRQWVFQGEKAPLFNASKVPIKRHVKVRSKANPFDPEWEIYFEERRGRLMAEDVSLSSKLKRLWNSQRGRCLHCQLLISKESGWHIHHLIPKIEGGKESLSNLVLLHPNCHRQVHHQDLKVVKPLSKRELVKA